MPSKRQRKFCTIFVRSEAEKQAAALVKDLNETKQELKETKESLAAILREIEDLKGSKRGRPKKSE